MCDVVIFNQWYFQGSISNGVIEKGGYNLFWKNDKIGGEEERRIVVFNYMDSGFFDQLNYCER